MAITDYYAKYIAHVLTLRHPPDSPDRLSGTVASAQVDLNPHQVGAALFAFQSPLSQGALLADEVGLGKTIEAGLVLSQKWAEHKRHILVITPSSLRKQWLQELTEKFFLPCRILETKSWNAAIRQGQFRPFDMPDVVICSYQFARNKAADVHALLKALDVAFAKLQELGAEPKAIIFTESRRTQNYLLRLLTDSEWSDGIVLFNGSNTDERSRQIYQQWLERHRGTDRVTGSRTADMRSALVDYFRERGRIMIATEAGAEGINLQFCSLVVNYDLPWNPQRIEQRIGRCHRYGQKHDVVVVNFLNRKNAADQRVFELLDQKFHLFEGVFGASDEVPGSIESGVDFEKRIAAIYQQCRKPQEIQGAFDQLQLDLSLEINRSMARTRHQLLENFDDEVREKLRIRDEDSKASLNRYERLLVQLTRHELGACAESSGNSAFTLKAVPEFVDDAGVALGSYELPRRSGEAHLYRLNHPLAEAVTTHAKAIQLPAAEIRFDHSLHKGRVSALQPFIGQHGELAVWQFSVESLEQPEDHLIIVARTDSGEVLDEDTARRLLALPGEASPQAVSVDETRLSILSEERQTAIQRHISERNARFFEAEAEKLDGWADDLKLGLEREIKDFDRQIKEARRGATAALTLEDKLTAQKRIKALEGQRNQKRRSLFDAQDRIDAQREEMISKIEGRMQQSAACTPLFLLRWALA